MRLEVLDAPTWVDINTIRQGVRSYNLAQVPELVNYSDEEFNVIIREDNRIVAGAICNFDWDWLYFDTVWTDATLRGKGYGSLIMQTAHSYAVYKGITKSYLMTTSFQARPFYEKLGYTRFGYQQDRPRTHVFNFMKHTALEASAIPAQVAIETPPQMRTIDTLERGLLTNIAKYDPLEISTHTLLLRDSDNKITGGLVGYLFWDWFDVRYIWVSDNVRGQGWGKHLLDHAETIARSQNCVGLLSDIVSFHNLAFFQSQGFDIFATLDQRPPQYHNHFLEKRF